MIRWEGLDPARIERAVKMLIRDRHPEVQGIDGAGGDAGRDIKWDSPEGLIIFEVKSFTARLTNSQKRQIKRSLTRAAAHDPVRWVLVIPLDPSQAEETWFAGCRRDFPKIALEWRGRDWLDGQFADRPPLRRYVEGPDYDLLERARELGHEQAALEGGAADLRARLRRLHVRANELSPHWRTHFSADDDAIVLAFTGFDLDLLRTFFTFPPDDPEAAGAEQELKRALDYGVSVTIDARYAAPFGDSVETGRVTVAAAEDTASLPLPCTLALTEPNGVTVATIDVSLTRRTAGARGMRLHGTDASGAMSLVLTVDRPADDGSQTGTFELTLDELSGRFPYAVRAIADFILAFTPGRGLTARFGPVRIGHADIEERYFDDARGVARLAVAMDELQAHFERILPIPAETTYRDLRELEMVRELLNGGRAQWPWHAIKANIYSDRLADFLALDDVSREQGAIVVRTETMSFTFANQTFDLGPVQFWGPKMRLSNLRELEAAVGTGVDPEARWVCMEGEHIYIRQLASIDEDA